jgi:hypothetical protein
VLDELVVIDFVRECGQRAGLQPPPVDRATTRALHRLATGASVVEACREGQRLIASSSRHASTHRTPRSTRTRDERSRPHRSDEDSP